MSENPPDQKPPKPPKLCPKGHPTGTKVGKFRCGVGRCAHESAAMYGPEKHDTAIEKLPQEEQEFLARKQLAALPEGLKGEQATQWAQEKLVDLLPEAVASLAYDLRYGTPKVRSEAADKVLRANGLDKREAREGGGGLIVLNIGTGATGIPWLERLSNKKD